MKGIVLFLAGLTLLAPTSFAQNVVAASSAEEGVDGLFHLIAESNGSGKRAFPGVYDPGSSKWATGSPATPAATPPDRFGGLSTRAFVSTGADVLISGFIITGTGTKKVLLRALGPSLSEPGALADPTLSCAMTTG